MAKHPYGNLGNPMVDYNAFLEQWHNAGLLRRLRVVERQASPHTVVNGRPLLSFSSNNYLGLADHPLLIQAAQEAIARHGMGAGASRLIGGNHVFYRELEDRLAVFKQGEAALIFSSGFVTNLSVLPTLAQPGDLILLDRLCHSSLVEGARLSRATLRVFHHNDPEHLTRLLKSRPVNGKVLVLTEGVFSMDGDIAPLDQLISLAEQHEIDLYVDDAHATGVLGHTGRGTLEHFGIGSHPRVIQMGTLSKALGSLGGFVVGSRALIDYLIQKARGLIYSTALPPAVLAAALAAMDLLEKEPERRRRLWDLRHRLHRGLQELGLNTLGSQSPILPILFKDTQAAVHVSKRLWEEGIFVPAIRPPTVPRGKNRLRLSVMATHSEQEIDLLLDRLKTILGEMKPCPPLLSR